MDEYQEYMQIHSARRDLLGRVIATFVNEDGDEIEMSYDDEHELPRDVRRMVRRETAQNFDDWIDA